MKRWQPKDPDENADFGVDWSNRLAGDTIVSSSWILPAGLISSANSYEGNLAIIWLHGGTLGKTYEVLNRVVTAGGRTFDQTVSLRIKSK